MRTSAANPAANGFTLLELLVVIGVLTLATAAVGNLAVPDRRASLERVTRETVTLLETARTEAMRSGRVQRVTVDPETGTVSDDAQTHRLDGVAIGVTYALHSGAGAPSILFYPDGSSTGGTIRLGAGKAESRIHVHWLTGDVNAEE